MSGLYEEIEDLIGRRLALRLFAARGGARVQIPARAGDGHWLVELVGREAADILCAHWRQGTAAGGIGGAELDLPRGPTGAHAAARGAMMAALDAGATAEEAARRSGLTRRTAYRMRSRREDDPRQGRLFGDPTES